MILLYYNMENKCVNAFCIDEFESDSEESSVDEWLVQGLNQKETLEQEQYFEVKKWEQTGLSKYVTISQATKARLYLECGEDIPGVGKKAMAVIQHTHNEVLRLKEKKGKMKDPSYFLFITLRPKAGDFLKFKEHVDHVVNSAFFKERCDWCFEQKGESDESAGSGYHCHIMYRKHGARSGRNLIRPKMVLDKLGKLGATAGIDYGEGNQGIDIQTKWYNWYDKQIEYMMGEKNDVSKFKAVVFDRIWRKRNGLEQIYRNY